MNTNLLIKIKYMSKYVILGIVLQTILFSVISAREVEGQSSIENVFLDINLNGLKIQQAFVEIEKKTSFKFSYKKKAIGNKRISNIDGGTSSLASVLREIGKEGRLKFRRINENIHVTKSTDGTVNISEYDSKKKDILLSGMITDDNGEALIGAYIKVKGTSAGATTDIDGRYNLEVPEGSVLIISYVGYITQEVTVGSLSVLDVQLKVDDKLLSEVVVVAYGKTDRRKLTGSVQSVAATDLEQVPIPSFDNMLQGKAAGVLVTPNSGQPGGSTSVRIRGIGSISAGSAPLYVMDGVPLNIGDLTRTTQTANILSTIDPNEIESINILKDASAASIYGSRAANGVVLITTKSGSVGKTKFKFTTQHGVSDWENPNNFSVMNSEQFTEYMREAVINGGGDPDDPNANGGSTYFPIRPDTISTDWLNDYAFQEGVTHQYGLSASGGTEKTRFFSSVGYFDQEGIAVATGLKRISTRMNLDHSANDKLTIGFKVGFYHTTQNSRFGSGTSFADPIYGGVFLSPLYPVFANAEQIASGADRGTGFNFDTPGFGGHNVAATVALSDSETVNTRLSGNFSGSYDILPSLTFRTSLGIDLINIDETEYRAPQHPDGLNTQGRGREIATTNQDVVVSNVLEYNFSSGSHTFSTLAGSEYQESTREYVDAEATGFASDKLRTINSASTPEDIGSFKTIRALWGIFLKTNYDFDNKYFLDLSFRRDGSSRFGANNRYANFWSVGGAYNISEEDFMSGIGFIDELKIRGSYGTSGNQSGIGNFSSLGLYTFTNTSFTTANGTYSGSRPSNLANPDLRWEKNKAYNIGIDFTVLSGRLSGTVEYYNREASDMLLDVGISRTSGFNDITSNVGSMVNKGWEFSFNSTNIRAGGFEWNTNFNIAFNENEVTSLPDGADLIDDDDSFLINRVGESVRSYFLPRWAGVNPADGRPLWYDTDGNVTTNYGAADRQIVGSPIADFFGGFTNSFSYKGLSLSVFFYFNIGNEVYRNGSRFFSSDGSRFGRNQDVIQLRRWQKPGDVTDVPRIVRNNTDGGNNHSTRYLEDGSFVKLRNITLAYNLPQSLTNKIKLSGARIYIQGQNVKTWTNFRGADPETGIRGEDFGEYPIPRTFTIGLDANF